MYDHHYEAALAAAYLAECYMLGSGGFSQDPLWAYVEARRAVHNAKKSHVYLLTTYEGIERSAATPTRAEGRTRKRVRL